MQKFFKYLDEKPGFDYTVFAPGPGTSLDQKISRLPSMKFILYPECRISVPNYYLVAKTLDAFKPDMIHISTPFSVGLCGLLYAKKREIPVTAVYHTNFNDYLTYYRLRAMDGIIWLFFTWFHNHCDVNYCPSIHTREELLKRGLKNLELWVRGVDTDFFSPKYRGTLPNPAYRMYGKKILLYVGRVAAEKNITILLKAMESINRDYSDKVHLFIVGDGPMLEQVARWKLKNVTCTGYLTGVPLAQMYANADIFFFPSTSETFGNVILEAMASGLPVVGAYAAGVRDNLVDGINGIACQPGDPASLARGAMQLLEDDNLMRTLGRQAHAYAQKRSLGAGFEQLLKGWDALFCKPKTTTLLRKAIG